MAKTTVRLWDRFAIPRGPIHSLAHARADTPETGLPAPVRLFSFLFFFVHLSSDDILAINNCTNGVNDCAAVGSICTYFGPGTFGCSCITGYSGTGTACTAVNSCTNGGSNCASVGSTCTYTGPGTFACACSGGYSGNGVNCTCELQHPHTFLFRHLAHLSTVLYQLTIIVQEKEEETIAAVRRRAPILPGHILASVLLDTSGMGSLAFLPPLRLSPPPLTA